MTYLYCVGFNGPENQNNQRMQFENLLRLEEQQ